MDARRGIIAVTIIAGALAAYAFSTRREPGGEPAKPAPPPPASSVAPKDAAPPIGVVDASRDADGVLRAAWGSLLGQVGHSLASDGSPEGPMSFARAGDDLLVLDQVNQRIVHYDKDGRPIGSSHAPRTTQDIAVARDGSVVVLDRLVDKKVRIFDRDGKPKGELALPADLGETRALSGVFTDDHQVYVEKAHGDLVGIGTLEGQAPAAKTILTGRPSKSGKLLISAALASNKLTVNAFDRGANKLRYTRVVPFKTVREIELVDTDAKDVVYIGASEDEKVNIACLDPEDGHVLGKLSREISMVPEETFRRYAVADDGTITSAFITENGAEYRTAKCP